MSVSKNFKNIPRSPYGGATGVFLQKFSRRICAEAPGGPIARQRGGRPPRPPDSGAAGPQSARQRGDRLPRPYIRGWLPPPPHLPH